MTRWPGAIECPWLHALLLSFTICSSGLTQCLAWCVYILPAHTANEQGAACRCLISQALPFVEFAEADCQL